MRYKATAVAFDASHSRIAEAEAVCQSPTDASQAALNKLLDGQNMRKFWTSIETTITIDC